MNTSSMKREYIQKSRKFYDAWAFILFAISCITFTTYTIFTIKANRTPLILFKNYSSIYNALQCTLIVSVAIILNFIGLSLFPGFFLKLTTFLYPISIILYMYFTKSNIINIIFGIIGLLFWVYFVYNYWKWLGSVGKIMKITTSILLDNIGTVLIGLVFVFLIHASQIFFILHLPLDILDMKGDIGEKLFTFFFALNLFWTLANSDYFFQVYCTSIIAYSAFKQSTSSFFSVLKNSLYALGSICFGGLLIAIITTIRFFVDQERDREHDRNGNGNTVSLFILCLVSFLLALLESFIDFANELTFPYVAIHGKDYRESMRSAFEVVGRESPVGVVGYSALKMCFFISTLTVGCLCGLSFYFSMKQAINIVSYKELALGSFLPLIFFVITMMMFSSGFIGLIYIATETPDSLKEEYKKPLTDALRGK